MVAFRRQEKRTKKRQQGYVVRGGGSLYETAKGGGGRRFLLRLRKHKGGIDEEKSGRISFHAGRDGSGVGKLHATGKLSERRTKSRLPHKIGGERPLPVRWSSLLYEQREIENQRAMKRLRVGSIIERKKRGQMLQK